MNGIIFELEEKSKYTGRFTNVNVMRCLTLTDAAIRNAL